jgi:rubrerythrin
MDRNDLINGCIKIESAAASTYSKLMQLFPDKKDFWEGLYNDEKEHISFLNDVKSLGLSDEVQKMDLLPTKPMIREALSLSNKISKKISNGPVIFKEALSLSLELEKSMVETYSNKIIASLLSCEDEASFKSLITSEKKHEEKIQKMLKKAG